MDQDFVKSVTGSGVGERAGDADRNPPEDRRICGDPFAAVTKRVSIDVPVMPPGPWQPEK
jgi:hypothetical protein